MVIEPKIFAKFDLNTLNQVSLLPVDIVRFIAMGFSQERNRYVYTGSKRLSISEEDRKQMLVRQKTTYAQQTIDRDKRRHFERLHKKYENPANYPVIPFYDRQDQTTGHIQPLSQYYHPPHTPDIYYTIDEKFIEQNNRFSNGYRDVCVDALNMLSGRYSRLFFTWLSGDKYDFHFSTEKLRKLLNIEDKYKKQSSINLILACVKKELENIEIQFDYAFCTQAEWEVHKQRIGCPEEPVTEAFPKKNKKKKNFTKNFYFRAKGMDKYRVPKGVESLFSKDIAQNGQYGRVRTFFNRELKMTDNYISEKWEYIKRYVDEWGAGTLIDFATGKMKEMAKQKKKPYNPKAVLMSLIVNRVKDLDKEGQGESTAFSLFGQEAEEHYDARGKSEEEIMEAYRAKYGHDPDSS